MDPLAYILIFSTLGSVLGLAGGALLLWRENLARRLSPTLLSFATGVLLGVAFFDLLPEAFEKAESGYTIGPDSLFIGAFLGLVAFFLIEKFVVWYHCHDDTCDVHVYPYLLLAGDAFHNLLDGFIMGVSFLIDIKLGLVTTLAIFFHELPQEIGDWGTMLHGGIRRGKVILWNVLSAFIAPIGALVMYFVGGRFENYLPLIAAFAAGGFIYIATADLIPQIHKTTNRKQGFILQLAVFLFGVGLMYGFKFVE